MEFSRKEILNALAIIQKVCNSTDCFDCPLRSEEYENEGCTLKVMTPNLWELNEEKETWRAFI